MHPVSLLVMHSIGWAVDRVPLTWSRLIAGFFNFEGGVRETAARRLIVWRIEIVSCHHRRSHKLSTLARLDVHPMYLRGQ